MQNANLALRNPSTLIAFRKSSIFIIDPPTPKDSSSTTQKLLVDACRIGHICTHKNGRKKVTSGMDAFHLKSKKEIQFHFGSLQIKS